MSKKNLLKEADEGTTINVSLDGIPESTKEELLNPPAKLLGQAISGIIHAVFDPLVRFNIVRNQQLKDFKDKVEASTNEIPEENRDDKKIGLTLKAFEESKYQLDSEELRQMFANLISSTVDNRKNNIVQPSFSSVLKELTPEDANLIKLFAEETTLPLVSIRAQDKNGTGMSIKDNILIFNNTIVDNEFSLFSLERLGLIILDSGSELKSIENQTRYQNFENHPMYSSAQKMLPINTENFVLTKIILNKGKAKLTPFGKAFISCVI